MKGGLTILFSSCFSLYLNAQVFVKAQLDTTSILIGDQIELQLTLEASKNATIKDVKLSVLDSVSAIEVIGKGQMLKIRDGLFTQNLVLTSFDSGYHWVPPIPVIYEENGSLQTTQTNRLPLAVRTIPITSDTTSITPIKSIIKEPLKIQDILPYLLAIIGVIALAIGVIWWRRHQRKETVPAYVPPPPPPHEVALQKIKQLREKQLWQKGEIKAFQSDLTYIVREYLENRFGVPALESTTESTLQYVRQLNISKVWPKKLKEMFYVADMVKFAKAKPPADFHHKVLDEAEAFIIETKPKVQITEQPEQASE